MEKVKYMFLLSVVIIFAAISVIHYNINQGSFESSITGLAFADTENADISPSAAIIVFLWGIGAVCILSVVGYLVFTADK